MSNIYKTDKQYLYWGLFGLALSGCFIWATPSFWTIVVGFWLVVLFIAYMAHLKRNSR